MLLFLFRFWIFWNNEKKSQFSNMQTSFLHEEILVESIFKLILENGKVKNIWYKTINLQFKSGGILAIELDVVPLM